MDTGCRKHTNMSKSDWEAPEPGTSSRRVDPWGRCPAAFECIDRLSGGVYIVYRAGPLEPAYLDRSPAGTFRGNLSVPHESLEANWVPGARVVYIEKAKHGRLG